MDIANELRKLADQIEGTSLNTVEEKNIKKVASYLVQRFYNLLNMFMKIF